MLFRRLLFGVKLFFRLTPRISIVVCLIIRHDVFLLWSNLLSMLLLVFLCCDFLLRGGSKIDIILDLSVFENPTPEMRDCVAGKGILHAVFVWWRLGSLAW